MQRSVSMATMARKTEAIYCLAIATFLSLSSLLFSTSYGVVSAEHSQITAPHSLESENCSTSNSSPSCEIEVMKFKAAQLELLLEMTDVEVYTKSVYIQKCEKKIEELSLTIHQLESALSDKKVAPDYEDMINAYEAQVRELEADVKRNARDLQLLKVTTEEAENRVNLLAAQVKSMANIVPELWFHVQKLEQAREVIERRTAELRRHIRNQRCSFCKFLNHLFGRRYQKIVAPYTSEALNQLTRLFSAVKKYHHQLQGFVKREMEKNEFTAVLADEELVFFLTSAIVIFPFMLALIWLSSHWR